jgi:hydrogenase expression/formation protein HypC
MCLAVPMKLVERAGDRGVCDAGGVFVRVQLDLLPAADIGNYVIVHAGYALSIVDDEEANQTMDLLARLREGEA